MTLYLLQVVILALILTQSSSFFISNARQSSRHISMGGGRTKGNNQINKYISIKIQSLT